jgi:hypothetical protein
MSDVRIQIEQGQTSFRPGEAIRGIVTWVLDAAPRTVEVRLVWHTAGKGDRDVGVVEKASLHAGGSRDQQPFELRAPDGPYSFSGRLISLVWGVEVVIEPGSLSARQDIVIAPAGVEVDLYASGEPK